MKDVQFNSNLEEVINNANYTYSLKNDLKKGLIVYAGALIATCGTIFGLDVEPFTFINTLEIVGITTGIWSVCAMSGSLLAKKQNKKQALIAESKLEILGEELTNEAVLANTENLKDAVVFEQGSKTIESFDSNKKLSSKEETSVKDFCFIDNNGYNTVLRQTSKFVFDSKGTKTTYNLALMEEEDLKGITYPVKKVLVRK